MDLVGLAPASSTGERFSSSVWRWRPLWDYCMQVAGDLVADVSGHTNDGDGLDSAGARQLADILDTEISSGRAADTVEAFRTRKAALPREECTLCGSTGIRNDAVGILHGMPDRALDEMAAILLGRTHGWCNGCGGEGTREPFALAYQLEIENIQAFAVFARESGGFRIF